jgi:hypothetical protein
MITGWNTVLKLAAHDGDRLQQRGPRVRARDGASTTAFGF